MIEENGRPKGKALCSGLDPDQQAGRMSPYRKGPAASHRSCTFVGWSVLAGAKLCRRQRSDQRVGREAAEWAAGARERELEKIALQHIKTESKAAERAARAEVRLLPLTPRGSLDSLRLDAQTPSLRVSLRRGCVFTEVSSCPSDSEVTNQCDGDPSLFDDSAASSSRSLPAAVWPLSRNAGVLQKPAFRLSPLTLSALPYSDRSGRSLSLMAGVLTKILLMDPGKIQCAWLQ